MSTRTNVREEETETINVRVPVSLLGEIDDFWQGRGFTSRSEYVRHTLRTSLHPSLTLSAEAQDAARAHEESGDREYVSLDDV